MIHLVQGRLRIIRRVNLIGCNSRDGSDLLVAVGRTIDRSDWSQDSLLFNLAANGRTRRSTVLLWLREHGRLLRGSLPNLLRLPTLLLKFIAERELLCYRSNFL